LNGKYDFLALPIRAFTSASDPPCSSMMLPKYIEIMSQLKLNHHRKPGSTLTSSDAGQLSGLMVRCSRARLLVPGFESRGVRDRGCALRRSDEFTKDDYASSIICYVTFNVISNCIC
ncbi:hypothetical protein MS3_00011033, partial [Schistosoma haematobium]